jgi:poly(hydroxyalkanoate) granule-associated protein
MARKKLRKKVQGKTAVDKLTGLPGIESAREVWLAGLGALNVAQSEGGKIIEQGNKLFETLVAEGSKLESKTKKDVEGVVSDVMGEVENRVKGVKSQTDTVRKQASDNWDKLESIFEDRVSRALGSLGIPTRDEISTMAKRVEELSAKVDALSAPEQKAGKKPAAAGTKPRKKAAVKKSSVKKATVKKASAKKASVKKTSVKKAGVKKTETKKAA